MCELCVQHSRGAAFHAHPVFPSLTYQIAIEELASCRSSTEQDKWRQWTVLAEQELVGQLPRTNPPVMPVPCCDVILCLGESEGNPRETIESILGQSGAIPILHLCCSRFSDIDLSAWSTRWNVHIHRFDEEWGPLQAARRILESLMTPYLAIQNSIDPSAPHRLAESIRALLEQGAELVVASSPTTASKTSDHDLATVPSLIPSTLVIRRAALIDLDAFQSTPLESASEFLVAAHTDGWRVVVLEHTSAMILSTRPAFRDSEIVTGLVQRPAPSPLDRRMRHDFDTRSPPIACDVVLPFHGQLHYVRQAIESLLSQQGALPVIHLVDDTSPEDTTAFLDEWSQHPQLRVYRNKENIGQFQSFNNTSRYWETELVAVQDADDISLPHRLAWAATLLQQADADYFGGAVELFGDDDLIQPEMKETSTLKRVPRAAYRRSYYPRWDRTDYFLENPTAVFRAVMFREMGGYADFGDRLMNRTSLDTEFQLRCYFHGVRFAITREVVTRYRVHASSATQDRETGWGTSARAASIRHLEECCRWYQSGQFDPRVMGALGRYTHLTERWK